MSEILLLPPGRPKAKLRKGNPYQILGVRPNASANEIKHAYLRLAREFHPDINPSPDARKAFEIINRAYHEVTAKGNLTRLKLKCDIVEPKAMYAEFLHLWKRVKTLTGIETDVRDPRAGLQGVDKELTKKMMRLAIGLSFLCLICKDQEECNRATGFGEVKDIHQEIMAKKAFA